MTEEIIKNRSDSIYERTIAIYENIQQKAFDWCDGCGVREKYQIEQYMDDRELHEKSVDLDRELSLYVSKSTDDKGTLYTFGARIYVPFEMLSDDVVGPIKVNDIYPTVYEARRLDPLSIERAIQELIKIYNTAKISTDGIIKILRDGPDEYVMRMDFVFKTKEIICNVSTHERGKTGTEDIPISKALAWAERCKQSQNDLWKDRVNHFMIFFKVNTNDN